jgi:hypothetical protein
VVDLVAALAAEHASAHHVNEGFEQKGRYRSNISDYIVIADIYIRFCFGCDRSSDDVRLPARLTHLPLVVFPQVMTMARPMTCGIERNDLGQG